MPSRSPPDTRLLEGVALMSLRLRGRLVVGLAAALLVALTGPGRAEDQGANGRSDAASKKTDAQGRASGVIVKVERVKPGASSGASTDKPDRPRGHRTLRLTINTAAVWRDWARDQAMQSNSESSNVRGYRVRRNVQ